MMQVAAPQSKHLEDMEAHIMAMEQKVEMQIQTLKIGIEEAMAEAVDNAVNAAMGYQARCGVCSPDSTGPEFT